MTDHEIRNSICPYCKKEFESVDKMKHHVFKAHRGSKPPSPEGEIRLNINGNDYSLSVEPRWTLYDVIHDRLGLTGSKQFCDRGACGSCTVIIDGKAVLSCMMLAVECDGKAIETVEGIAEKNHPLIESYVKHHAMQCGYCTPGFVTTSKALLDRNINPTEDEIREELSGNLCRCGTYPQHTIAVLETAERIRTAKAGGAEKQ